MTLLKVCARLKNDREAIKDFPPTGRKLCCLGASWSPVAAALLTPHDCIYRAQWMSHLAACPLLVHQIYRSPHWKRGGVLIYDAPPSSLHHHQLTPHPSHFLQRQADAPSCLRLADWLRFIKPVSPPLLSCVSHSLYVFCRSIAEASSETDNLNLNPTKVLLIGVSHGPASDGTKWSFRQKSHRQRQRRAGWTVGTAVEFLLAGRDRDKSKSVVQNKYRWRGGTGGPAVNSDTVALAASSSGWEGGTSSSTPHGS